MLDKVVENDDAINPIDPGKFVQKRRRQIPKRVYVCHLKLKLFKLKIINWTKEEINAFNEGRLQFRIKCEQFWNGMGSYFAHIWAHIPHRLFDGQHHHRCNHLHSN